MGIDVKNLAAAKSYTKQSLLGAGALKGEKGDKGNDAPSIVEINIDENNILSVKLSDGKELICGTIKTIQGEKGQDGISVPKGGNAGAVLVKKSENDYDAEWKDISDTDNSSKYTLIQGIL